LPATAGEEAPVNSGVVHLIDGSCSASTKQDKTDLGQAAVTTTVPRMFCVCRVHTYGYVPG
jgi:hypothetical protein